jgi:hypothetical protein
MDRKYTKNIHLSNTRQTLENKNTIREALTNAQQYTQKLKKTNNKRPPPQTNNLKLTLHQNTMILPPTLSKCSTCSKPGSRITQTPQEKLQYQYIITLDLYTKLATLYITNI